MTKISIKQSASLIIPSLCLHNIFLMCYNKVNIQNGQGIEKIRSEPDEIKRCSNKRRTA